VRRWAGVGVATNGLVVCVVCPLAAINTSVAVPLAVVLVGATTTVSVAVSALVDVVVGAVEVGRVYVGAVAVGVVGVGVVAVLGLDGFVEVSLGELCGISLSLARSHFTDVFVEHSTLLGG